MTEQLIQLAKVAGIGGLAFGVLVLIFREVIRKQIFPTLPPRQAYRLLRLIVVLTFTIALVGLIGWVYLEHLRSPFSELFRGNLKQKETEIFLLTPRQIFY
jgi:Mg2+/Co2+ transporter CorB